ncbi:MAG TPA: hypothetical protein VGN63_12540, partial [Flavisolibacter sp.]|nr:hypothetical protein [Flavisolibacter sp.]
MYSFLQNNQNYGKRMLSKRFSRQLKLPPLLLPLFIVVLSLVSVSTVFANEIGKEERPFNHSITSISLATNSACPDGEFKINFEFTGTSSVTFTAQLSSSSSFTTSTPIGSVTTNASPAFINAKINSATSPGDYYIRVVVGHGTGSVSEVKTFKVNALATFYEDADGDGFGNSAVTTTSCGTTPPSGFVSNSGDCADNDATLNPATVWYLDADGDNYHAGTATGCESPGAGYVRSVT